MARPTTSRRPPAPRRLVIWKRAIPIFIGMMGALYFADFLLSNYFHQQPSIWASLVAGLVGAFLISRYATVTPPPPPSKSQQRRTAAQRRAATAASADEEDAEEASAESTRPATRSRRRKRR